LRVGTDISSTGRTFAVVVACPIRGIAATAVMDRGA
jgi:hypothetical protein